MEKFNKLFTMQVPHHAWDTCNCQNIKFQRPPHLVENQLAHLIYAHIYLWEISFNCTLSFAPIMIDLHTRCKSCKVKISLKKKSPLMLCPVHYYSIRTFFNQNNIYTTQQKHNQFNLFYKQSLESKSFNYIPMTPLFSVQINTGISLHPNY